MDNRHRDDIDIFSRSITEFLFVLLIIIILAWAGAAFYGYYYHTKTISLLTEETIPVQYAVQAMEKRVHVAGCR